MFNYNKAVLSLTKHPQQSSKIIVRVVWKGMYKAFSIPDTSSDKHLMFVAACYGLESADVRKVVSAYREGGNIAAKGICRTTMGRLAYVL